jgi:hypothetical protein
MYKMKNSKFARLGCKNGMFGRAGSLNPMFGKIHSQDTIDKIKQARARQIINPMQGKHHSFETKKKISDILKNHTGWVHSIETRKKMSTSAMGHPVSYEVREKLRISHRGLKASKSTKEKMSKSRVNYIKKLGNKFFIKFNYGHRTNYNGMSFRSSWEAKFAKYLDEQKIIWQYEPMLEIPYGIYFPDFYLIDLNVYVEIKGYWRNDAKIKFNQASKIYPMMLLEGKDLKAMGILK